MPSNLSQIAEDLAGQIARQKCKVVFAESCTGGLISATMTRIPGISEFYCGSAVVYRLDTKTRWLGVDENVLIDPGPVSEIVARQMAFGVLQQTPEANWSAAITGHLGPNAPVAQDGLVYISIGQRDVVDPARIRTEVIEQRLGDPQGDDFPQTTSLRERRQKYAAGLVLRILSEKIAGSLT